MDMFTKLKKDIDSDLSLFLKETKKRFKDASDILYKCISDFLKRDGKRIRPMLFLLSYQGYTRKRKFSYKTLLRSSLSLELLHDFLLVHDDVIDNSDLRRGKPTMHKMFNRQLKVPPKSELGPNLSIVAGDIIFALAIEAFSSFEEDPVRKERALLKFTESAASTGMGEFLDVVNDVQKIEDITKKDIFNMYILKTAKYTFEGPLLIGAILAGTPKKELEKLSKLGIILGQAFQIQDDMLDIFSSSKKIGKPVLSDLNESKKTILIWRTYHALKGKNKKLFKYLLEKKKKTHKDLIQLKDFIKMTGTDKYCLNKTLSLLKEADSILAALKMRTKYKTVLEGFVQASFSKIRSLNIKH